MASAPSSPHRREPRYSFILEAFFQRAEPSSHATFPPAAPNRMGFKDFIASPPGWLRNLESPCFIFGPLAACGTKVSHSVIDQSFRSVKSTSLGSSESLRGETHCSVITLVASQGVPACPPR